ncbi:MAG: HlyD family efflux transporter periplasmic adaptor subunit [Taibaiella sp.]|nr:HlyD family efflux transporter periplasmic adaptor subunit [Taibaiella sp.]
MPDIMNRLEKEGHIAGISAFDRIYRAHHRSRVKHWFWGAIVAIVVILFLPWTQNIRARGSITTLRQEHRPQELNSIIAGRVVKWYVKEGDIVQQGDTIARLAEIKDAYLDPELISRTGEQIAAKRDGIARYGEKISATEQQISALEQTLTLKRRQLALKVISDSMEAVAAANQLEIADAQYRRQKVMRDSGLASLVQLEQRNQAYQAALAKKMGAEIKYMNTKTEMSQVEQEYAEKVFKARGEKAAALSEIATANAEVSKLSNQYANYSIRNGMYYLLAPQSGQVTQASKAGLNEIIKEGEKIVEIIPLEVDYAVEIFVRPVDVPLLSKGQKVRFLFDGYPAIVFSGWPQASYGLFSGHVVAIENAVNAEGKFRVLVGEDRNYKPWPRTLRNGTGASAIALLKDVPIWYELWRNINGFPPDYYKANEAEYAGGKSKK